MTPLFIFLSSLLWIISFPVAFRSDNLIPGWVSSFTIWISLVPILVAIRNRSTKETFRIGYIFGFFSNAGVLFWIIVALQKYGNLPVYVSILIMLAMICMFAFYPALAFYAIFKKNNEGAIWPLGSITFALLFWILHIIPFGGFPWANPAYALYDSPRVIQIADLFGIHGITFMICLSNFVIADTITAWRTKAADCFPKKGIALTLLLFIATLVYGHVQLKQHSDPNSKTLPLKIALLQGNIPQDQKWSSSTELSVLSTYRELTSIASQLNPDLIVWPEASLPMAVSHNTTKFAFLKDVANTNVVVGAATWAQQNGTQSFYNSAFVISPGGDVVYRYDKQRLVPFGEYVPFSNILPMQYIVPSVAGNFGQGASPTSLPTIKDNPFAILICYEVLFPDLSVAAVRQGARLFVNITNDAWFDYTSGPFQHVHFGIFRAIETRRPLVRAANTGVTTWIDSTGKMFHPTPLFQRDILQASIQPSTELTFYVRYPLLVPILLTLALILIRVRRFQPWK